jgi:flagellin-like protein
MDENAVSSTIGIVLMVAVTVILAAAVGAFALNLAGDTTEKSPTVSMDLSWGTDGGDTVVDVTPKGVGADPAAVRGLARSTGLQFVHGTAYYVRSAHPDRVDDATVEDLESEFVSDVREGIDDTDVRAGVVGEMLTDLFALHSPGVHARRDEMLALAPSFGEGLQLTNILKDTWDDRRRGACWLPREVFARHGVDLAALRPEDAGEGFARAMDEMVALAHGHLRNALEYTLMIPPHDTGMRRFCLWAIGMALRTLQRIHRTPGFTRGGQVKISRSTVRIVVTATNLAARNERLLRLLFATAARGLPLRQPVIDADVSEWEEAESAKRTHDLVRMQVGPTKEAQRKR